MRRFVIAFTQTRIASWRSGAMRAGFGPLSASRCSDSPQRQIRHKFDRLTQVDARACWVAALTLSAGALALPSAVLAADEFNGQVRTQYSGVTANTLGPLAAANELQSGLLAAPADALSLVTELRGKWRALSGTVTLSQQQLRGRALGSGAVVNELFASHDGGAWQWSVGKKVVAWDVGFGFRPNDVVQQEERRTLVSVTPEGRPVVMAEYFTQNDAWSVLLVNPTADAKKTGGAESAFASRYYFRSGSVDWHGFARLGEHTGASLGLATVWVPGESLELHGSIRTMQRFDGLANATANAPLSGLLPASPWQLQLKGAATQALIGSTWTSASQTSIYLEAWYDGTAPGGAQWRSWSARNQSLKVQGAAAAIAAPGRSAPAAAFAGNLAWQLDALGTTTSLRRSNLFARWAGQYGAWQPSVDVLVTPEDAGRVFTAALQWQGDRLQWTVALRRYGGPADAVLVQLPQRQTLVLNSVWAF